MIEGYKEFMLFLKDLSEDNLNLADITGDNFKIADLIITKNHIEKFIKGSQK